MDSPDLLSQLSLVVPTFNSRPKLVFRNKLRVTFYEN